METIVANALEAFEEGVHDVVLGEAGGEAIAVAVEGKFVFVKQLERIDEALVLDENLPRDAR